jgi:hypothetical protein
MVAYARETRLLRQQVEWEPLITAACAAAQGDTGSAITAVSLTHSIAGLSTDEVEAIIGVATRCASEAELSVEADANTRHLTLRFVRQVNAVEPAKSVPFGDLLGVLRHTLNLSRERHA